MSLAQQKQIDLLRKEVRDLKNLVLSRDEKMLKKVMQEAMALYLEKNVDFSMSTEGKIKELIG